MNEKSVCHHYSLHKISCIHCIAYSRFPKESPTLVQLTVNPFFLLVNETVTYIYSQDVTTLQAAIW